MLVSDGLYTETDTFIKSIRSSRFTIIFIHFSGSMQTCPQFHIGMEWSADGPIPGKHCTHMIEPSDPDSWNDNYLCFNDEYNVQWSSAGVLNGLNCVQTVEPAEPVAHTWSDNYLCVPNDSPFQLRWSHNGTIPSLCCERLYAPDDPHTWYDNFVCVTNFV